jgi:malonyl-CoA O-methyltransferase
MHRNVVRAFNRASRRYDADAVLQADVRETLLARLALARLEPATILDAGAGTGHASKALRRRYPKARVIALDIAAGMLKQAARQQSLFRKFDRIRADAAKLPFADGSVDLIFSNLMLQWCDPDAVLTEFRRVLSPGGCLTLTSYGPDTLRELRSAWAAVDDRPHVNLFIDMHDLGDALVRAGFAAPVLDVERYTLNYADVPALIRDLKSIGANTLLPAGGRGLTGRGKFSAMQSAYEPFRKDGRLPASYEVVFANAWAPSRTARPGGEATPGEGSPRETRVSVEALSAELRKKTAARDSARDSE